MHQTASSLPPHPSLGKHRSHLIGILQEAACESSTCKTQAMIRQKET